jgi:uncharacterized membrane protein YedE/YeeE
VSYYWFDLAGNFGVLLILVAYFLLQLEKLNSNSIVYSILNAVGASGILTSLYFKFNLSAFLIEFFWLLISIMGIVKFFLKKTPVLIKK